MRAFAWWIPLAAGLAATRLTHSGVLWVEECYPAAAAIQILHGKIPYRDFWFDKPPLSAMVYLLWGAWDGWPLRLAGAAWVLLTCWLAYRCARAAWGEWEGRLAACLLGFFLTFGVPSAVIALAPDLLMVAPHLAAAWLAWRGSPFSAGVVAGLALQVHTKGLLVLAVCLVWQWRAAPRLVAGFALPNMVALGLLAAAGAAGPWWEQVWRSGFLYAADTFLENPIRAGLGRTAGWMGFHATLVAGAGWYWWRERSPEGRRIAMWALLSLAGVAVGWRFFPRYYFLLLPVMTLAAARGLALAGRRRAILALVLLVVPLARFGPRYGMLAADLAAGREHRWVDLAMSQDSRQAARMVHDHARPGDTLLVWGYRPEVFVHTRLAAGTPFLDSQPLTGVLADRHLVDAHATSPEAAARNRRELTRLAPTFVVDGLGPYNPALTIGAWPELREWLAGYEVVGRSRGSVVYRARLE